MFIAIKNLNSDTPLEESHLVVLGHILLEQTGCCSLVAIAWNWIKIFHFLEADIKIVQLDLLQAAMVISSFTFYFNLFLYLITIDHKASI